MAFGARLGWFVAFTFLFFFNSTMAAPSFSTDFTITWGSDNARILDEGQRIELTLNESSGCGFASKDKYLFGSIDMEIKLVAGNSSGTVTAYYLFSEQMANHDELDFEFLGNDSGQPYILQTNVYSNGVGGREQRIYLWFDPTADFHTYSLLWNEQQIVFLVDGTPIRVFARRNNSAVAVPYLSSQPMRVYGSIWNGENWAILQGLMRKIDWREGPFVASFRKYRVDACKWLGENCALNEKWWNDVQYQVLNSTSQDRLNWVTQNYMVYDYCKDTARYPSPPPECVTI